MHVELAMRYGQPSIESVLARLKTLGLDELTLLPLYPQYATSSSQSTVDRVRELLVRIGFDVPLRVIGAFYSRPSFLDAFAEVARPVLAEARADHVLFSFHGLPERHITQLDASGQHCLKREGCCELIGAANAQCYRAQCVFTARALAKRLGLDEPRYGVSSQSRLTRKWIQPFTDHLLQQLPSRGVKRLAVVCPAFVADCLETLEEIGLRGREAFRAAGGEELTLVPSLNAHPAWVSAVVDLASAG
jgi:ferrochelatase